LETKKPRNKGFFLEAVDGITKTWGSDRVGVRISPSNVYGGIQHTDWWGTYAYLVERLNDFDLAYIHIVEPRIAGTGTSIHSSTWAASASDP
jgi:N-ethylmaleimide reductase